MAKITPESRIQDRIRMSQKAKDFLKDFREEVDSAQSDRNGWEHTRDEAFRRRYGMDFRNPEFPWPDSSDINLPFIDLHIERRKADLLSTIQQNPIATFEPNTAEAFHKASAAELHFDYLLNFAANDFRSQMYLIADSTLQNGVGVGKVFWDYQTGMSRETLTLAGLPQRLRQQVARLQLIRAERVTDTFDQARALMESDGQLAFSKRQFAKVIRELIAVEFELDEDEPNEAELITEVAQLFTGKLKEVKIRKRDILRNAPRVVSVDPLNLVVPVGTGRLWEAPWIVQKMFFTEQTFIQTARARDWDMGVVEEVVKTSKQRTERDRQKLVKDRQSGTNFIEKKNLIEIWESSFWYDVGDRRYDERTIAIQHPDVEKPLLWQPFPYLHNEWHFVDFPHEYNDADFYAHRGIPDKLKDLNEQLQAHERAKINAMMIELNPPILYRKGSQFNPDELEWMPGGTAAVTDPADVQVMDIPVKSVVHNTQEAIVRSWGEQYVGSLDVGLTSATSQTDPRTAREISAISAVSTRQQSLQLTLWSSSLKQVYKQMWQLVQQFGPKNVVFRNTRGEITEATKEDIQGSFDIVPNVPVGAHDPGLKAVQDITFLQTLIQSKQVMGNDPRWDIDIAQALLDHMERMDLRKSRRVIRQRSPEEAQAVAQQNQQAQQLELRKQEADIAAKLGAASGSFSKASANQQQGLPPVSVPPEGTSAADVAQQLGLPFQ